MLFWFTVSIFLSFMYHVIVSTCAQCDQSIYISVVYYALSVVYSMIYQSTYQLCASWSMSVYSVRVLIIKCECEKKSLSRSSHLLWLLAFLTLLYEYFWIWRCHVDTWILSDNYCISIYVLIVQFTRHDTVKLFA